jgi:osmotically-inducible protein OsmY
MVRTLRFWVAPAVAVAVLALGWASRAQEQTTTEKLKEKVGSAVTTIKKGAITAEEKIKESFAKAKDAVVSMGIEARVYARLHWEKALADSKIDLSAPKPGVIVLSGTVADAKARAKAVELTTDTVGVTEVVDHLVAQTTAATKAPAPAK